MARNVTASQKHQVMTKLLKTQAGRAKIAATIQEPLRALRDYMAIGRKAFQIDELPDAALSIYDQDIDTPAFVVAEEGDSIQRIIKSSRLFVPVFELASYPTIPFIQVKERRFDVVSRIKKKSKDELFRKEDSLIFSAIASAADAAGAENTPVNTGGALTMSFLADQFAVIEAHGHRVDKIFLNGGSYAPFRKAGRDYVDFETQRELLRTGYLGLVWGAEIYMSPEVPATKIFLVTEPEYFGVIPVRIDLTVLPADDPVARKFGWSVFEAIGIGIHNTKGLHQITIT